MELLKCRIPAPLEQTCTCMIVVIDMAFHIARPKGSEDLMYVYERISQLHNTQIH